LSDTLSHDKDSSLSKCNWRAHEEKQRNRNMQSDSEKSHLSNSDLHHSLSHLKGKANFLPGSNHHVSVSDKRGANHGRNYSGYHRKDGVFSDRKHHSSKDVVDDRFRDSVNSMQCMSHGHKSAHRRSISTDSGSKPEVKQNTDSPVFRENLSNSALKERMEKKLGWINSLPHNERQQHNGKETTSLIKTAVPRKPCTSAIGAERKTKTQSAGQDGTFTYYYHIV